MQEDIMTSGQAMSSLSYQWLLLIFTLLTGLSTLACAERIGVIGTDLDQQYGTRIPPGQSPAKGRFFLNTLDPATASGTVSSLRFCAYLNDDASVEIYQATIGFFRETGQHGQYDLLNSVGVAVNATPGLEYTCLSVSTPDIDVQVGDVIGVCSRTFNSSVASLGIAVSVDDDTSSLLRNGRMQRESLCPAVGSIPTNIAADQLETRSLLLPIYANITSSSGTTLSTASTTKFITASLSGTVNPSATVDAIHPSATGETTPSTPSNILWSTVCITLPFTTMQGTAHEPDMLQTSLPSGMPTSSAILTSISSAGALNSKGVQTPSPSDMPTPSAIPAGVLNSKGVQTPSPSDMPTPSAVPTSKGVPAPSASWLDSLGMLSPSANTLGMPTPLTGGKPTPSADVTASQGFPAGGPDTPIPSASASDSLSTPSPAVDSRITLCRVVPLPSPESFVIAPRDINPSSSATLSASSDMPPTVTPAPENSGGSDINIEVRSKVAQVYKFIIAGFGASLLVAAFVVLSVSCAILVKVRRKRTRKQKMAVPMISPRLLNAKRKALRNCKYRPYDEGHYHQFEMQSRPPKSKALRENSTASSTTSKNVSSSLQPPMPPQANKSVKPLLPPPKGTPASSASASALSSAKANGYPSMPMLPKSGKRNNSSLSPVTPPGSAPPPQAVSADTLPERYFQIPNPLPKKGVKGALPKSTSPSSGYTVAASKLGPIVQGEFPQTPIFPPSWARNNTTPVSSSPSLELPALSPVPMPGNPTHLQAPVLPRRTLSLDRPDQMPALIAGHSNRGRYPRLPMHPPSHSTLLEDSNDYHAYESLDMQQTTSPMFSDDGYNLPSTWNNEGHYEGHFQTGSDAAEEEDEPYYNFALIRNNAYALNMELSANPSYRRKSDFD